MYALVRDRTPEYQYMYIIIIWLLCCVKHELNVDLLVFCGSIMYVHVCVLVHTY